MQRIMIVTNSLTGGGAERSMNLVSNELMKRGWHVALIPINLSESDLITPTCEVFPLNREWRGSIFNTLAAIIKFNKVVRSWKPDVVILNCDLPEFFGAFLLHKQAIVVVEHINFPWLNRVQFGKVVRKILSARGAVWVAVSSHLGIWPSGELPHAVLQNPLTPSIESIHLEATTSHLRRLVYIGRLSGFQKQPEQMLKMAELADIDVEMIGDGLMREALQKEATAKKLSVKFSGQIKDPWSHVHSGDLLVVPSAYEGDGLVVIEGMKRGVPMLLSDIPDFRRFDFPDRNYCKNVGDFATRIDLYRDHLDSLIVPEETSSSILSSRSLEVVGDTWEEFLNSI